MVGDAKAASPLAQCAADALAATEVWCAARQWAGYDPYDGASGSVLASVTSRSETIARLVTQANKRLPVNCRKWLGIPERRIGKALALFVSGYARALRVMEDATYRERMSLIYGWLVQSAVKRPNDGLGWGYEFDVHTRWSSYRAGTPNVVATSFAVQALIEFGALTHTCVDDLVAGAARFVAEELVAENAQAGAFVSYIPGCEVMIHNANALGCSVLAQAGRLGDDAGLLEMSRQCTETLLGSRKQGGLWPYGSRSDLGWVDSYHTGYIVDSLLRVAEATGCSSLLDAGMRALAEYTDVFFGSDGEPLYSATSRWPHDIHSAATAIDVLSRWSAAGGTEVREAAQRVVNWTLSRMYDDEGAFDFQHRRIARNRVRYMRWNQAHMFAALGSFLADAASGR